MNLKGGVRDAASPPPSFSRVDCEVETQPQRYRVVFLDLQISDEKN